MSLTVVFKDPEEQIIVIENVDEDITIKELRNLFKKKVEMKVRDSGNLMPQC